MSKSSFVSISVFLLAIFCMKPEQSHSQDIIGKWSGTISMDQHWKGITGPSEKHVELTIVDNIVTGSVSGKSILIIDGKELGTSTCQGIGKGELWRVSLNADGTYDIEAISPEFTCSHSDGTKSVGTLDVKAHNQIINKRNFLTGTQINSGKVEGAGEGITTTTWTLYSGPLDAQLIITPIGYDKLLNIVGYNNWLPEPGMSELNKGSVMDIELKVRGRNGGNPTIKAVRFEVRLNNTSREPGITLNAPLVPSSNQLPDIRFIPGRLIGESLDEGQYIEFPSENGTTGKTTVGSYDGGGWTTLTAVAVLEGGIRIEGELLRPGGVKEIPIPKRGPNSKIATAWLTANGNRGETEDDEQSTGNTNKGDGLSVYEEYRGVIAYTGNGIAQSKPEFTRLDPKKKEVGIQGKKEEYQFFSEGINWFKTASGITPVLFSANEIPAGRELNKNHGHAHVYDQYVLKIENGPTTKRAAGENRPTTLEFMLPKQSDLIVINIAWIDEAYHKQDSVTRREGGQMPFTKAEMLASTVAHEIAHGVFVNHHGNPSTTIQDRTAYESSNPPFHIFDPPPPGGNGAELPVSRWPLDNGNRHYHDLDGITGEAGNEESGDLSCFMAYTSNYQWAFRVSNTDRSLYYYKVPLLPFGKKLCNSKTGTGINSPANVGVNGVNKYFGNAPAGADKGNCLSQLKLRD